MASDYTVNYNLDKYVGTDKPNLRDQYNSAMDKIDAQMHKQSNDLVVVSTSAANATSVAQAAKAAADKAQSSADTAQDSADKAQTAANNAQETATEAKQMAAKCAPVNHASTDTTYGRGSDTQYGHVRISDNNSRIPAKYGLAASTKLVADVADEVRKEVADYFNVMADISTYSVTGISCTLAQNAAGTVFKFYGILRLSGGSSFTTVTVPGLIESGTQITGIDTGLTLNTKPDTAYRVSACGKNMFSTADITHYMQGGGSSFAVGTNGRIYIELSGTAGVHAIPTTQYVSQDFPACLYFNANFGDVEN